MIRVSKLSYEYPGLRALDEVSFEIAQGSITALVGPNGAGKTTLIRCLAGMDRPLSGSIHVNGVDVVAEPRASHQHIGYLSDFFGLYEDLSVRQSLTYAAAANGINATRHPEVVGQTAERLGLSDRLDQRAGDLSRGLRQRVAIAQAVIHAPQVVLLDEPASGLDPEARYQLGELFLTLRKSGMTLMVSSHILAELEAYSTDLLIMRNGRMLEQRRLGVNSTADPVLELVVHRGLDVALKILDADPHASAVVADGNTIHFHFSGDDPARAELLRQCVAQEIDIIQFSKINEDLQQSYLRSINESGVAGES